MCRAAAEAAAQSELAALVSAHRKRRRLCRGAADTPVCSGRGWSHAPGGSVCRAAAEAAAQSELGQCPQGGRGGRRRQCRGAADTPVCSGRGGSHAPGGSVCRAAAEAAARSRSSKRACVAHQQLPSDWSRAALPVLEVVPLASQARSARSARAAGRAPARWPGVGATHFKTTAHFCALLLQKWWHLPGRFSGDMAVRL